MFERFTPGGRRVMVVAQHEAEGLGSPEISPEHILLAVALLADWPDSVVARVLVDAGVEQDALRAALLDRISSAVGKEEEKKPSKGKGIAFSASAKKALEMSLREALGLGHNYIAEFHMLLGVLAQIEASGDATWAAVFGTRERGDMQLDRARLQVAELAPENKPSTKWRRPRTVQAAQTLRQTLRQPRPSEQTEGWQRVLARAMELAATDPVGTDHLLVALLDVRDTYARTVLSGVKQLADREALIVKLGELRFSGVPDGAPFEATVRDDALTMSVRDSELGELLQRAVGDRADVSEVIAEALRELLRAQNEEPDPPE